ncbi:MAG TPA: helix-turn-helix transcriptional regulator [Polyangia bacterium]|nr:helix-turn-helix transcriptional regulator [Polyangia bacterium]
MHLPSALVRTAESFRVRAALGDLSGVASLLGGLGVGSSPLERAWCCAIRAQVGPCLSGTVKPPRQTDLEMFAEEEPGTRRVAALAAGDMARVAFLRFDRKALERWRGLLWRLSAGSEGGEIEVAILGALGAWLTGETPPLDLEGLATRAAGARLAGALVEICAIRALHALEAGDHGAGLMLARRASLMARTEGLPDAELLANMALVRARRYNRQTHLALRIAETLDRVATPPWRAWLDWERLFAGRLPATGAAEVGRAADTPALSVARLLKTAALGEPALFRCQVEQLRASLDTEPLRRDAAALIAALAPAEPPPTAELRAWREGASPLPPAALHGLVVPSLLAVTARQADRDDDPTGSDPAVAGAYVLLIPGAAGVRLLCAGLALALGAGAARVRQSRRRHGRVESLLAILALAGPDGLDEPSCFARVYGFGYVPAIHRGVVDVLVHRARGALEGIAVVARANGRLALLTTRPLLIPDPSSSRSTTDRVLRLLADRGRASAKEAAARLGLSLRLVQGALNELAGSHACIVERDGRRVTYAVEDSVFSEPTGRFAAGVAALALDSGSRALPEGGPRA